jgi:PadR family transcriptional regulator AphA
MLSHGPATSYDLKQRVGYTIGNFWAFAHSQLYDEPARLAEDGLVTATVEEGGRRKRTYSITPKGSKALAEWLASPTPEQTEVRDLGLHASHKARADGYIEQHEQIVNHADRWQVKSLELGIRFERVVEEFWADFIAELEAEEQK